MSELNQVLMSKQVIQCVAVARASTLPDCLLLPKLPKESIHLGLPPQKAHQCNHLIMRTTLLKHHVPIPSPLVPIHGILLENRLEHIGCEDLGAIFCQHILQKPPLNLKVSSSRWRKEEN